MLFNIKNNKVYNNVLANEKVHTGYLILKVILSTLILEQVATGYSLKGFYLCFTSFNFSLVSAGVITEAPKSSTILLAFSTS